MIEYLKFEMWPMVKTKIIFWWWIIKYGGKKNIPKEVIFEALEKTIESLVFNVEQAVRATPNDADEEERKLAFKALSKVQDLKDEIGKIK